VKANFKAHLFRVATIGADGGPIRTPHTPETAK